MEEALVARLVGVAGIGAIVGDRVSWFERPRPGTGQGWADVLPAITLSKVTPGREWTQEGPDGLDGPVVQFDFWGLSAPAVAALARRVLAEMETITPVTVEDWIFHPASLELELWSTEDGGADVVIRRIQMDFRFYHQAA